MRFKPASLRVRLTAWSTLFTLLCLGLCGVSLNLYLRYSLSASRSDSMRKREHRLLRFLETELRAHPRDSWDDHMRHFLEATPETDLVEIDTESGKRLYPGRDAGPGMARTPEPCATPCLTTTLLQGHHVRVLTHSTIVAGQPIRLMLIGSIDEHYNILHVITVGLLGLVPFVLLGSVLGGYGLSRRALASVGEITAQARRLSLTNLQARIPEPDTGDELQQLARAWNDMLARLETSATHMSQFTADASHDLRTALTVILANAQLALRRERTPERYQECLQSIVTESTHMLDMLEDMLLAVRSGGVSDSIEHAGLDLAQIVQEVFESAQASAALRDQTFDLESTAACLPLQGDRMALRRLISILVDNAIKYTATGGCIRLRLFGADPQHWTFEVIDDGIGIPLELQSRIFERLFRVDPARTQPAQAGHGLGLAIAAWIAESHHLQLDLRSTPGKGTTFRIKPEA